MLLAFSDSEEHIFNKVKEIVEREITEFTEQVDRIGWSFSGLEICSQNENVIRDGVSIKLSHQEFMALKCLAQHPGWVYSKEQIYHAICDNEVIENIENSIYCLIYSLRKKLEIEPRHPRYIQTVRGIGYKFVIPEE